MKLRFALITAIVALLLVPAALAGQALIRLDQPQPVAQGATISFTVTLPHTAPNPRIVLSCQDVTGTWVWGDGKWVADGTTFTLPTVWTLTSCVAKLGTFDKFFKDIAQTTFSVAH